MSFSTSNNPTLYFEEDITMINSLLHTYGEMIEQRKVSSYDLEEVMKATKEIAKLVQAKARKQTQMLELQGEVKEATKEPF